MRLTKMIFILGFLFFATGYAAEIYVDYFNGKSGNSGAKTSPFPDLAAAMSRAQPGDTVFVLPAAFPIFDNIVVHNKKGLPGKPIIIDGMFNTFTGTRNVSLKEWQEISPGLFSKKVKGPSWANRMQMSFNGKINYMGRRIKNKGSAPWKKIEELKECEWTFVEPDTAYFKLPEGKTLGDVTVGEAILVSGIRFSGENKHLVVRNMIVREFWNDGINIHGKCMDVFFENIAALYNSDDGLSSHKANQISIRNFISIGNRTGICHIDEAVSDHENIYIADIRDRDLFMLSSERSSFKNIVVDSSASGESAFLNGENIIENAVFLRRTPEQNFIAEKAGKSVFKNSMVSGFRVIPNIPDGLVVTDQQAAEKAVEEIRKSLFAIFGGKIEKELNQ